MQSVKYKVQSAKSCVQSSPFAPNRVISGKQVARKRTSTARDQTQIDGEIPYVHLGDSTGNNIRFRQVNIYETLTIITAVVFYLFHIFLFLFCLFVLFIWLVGWLVGGEGGFQENLVVDRVKLYLD